MKVKMTELKKKNKKELEKMVQELKGKLSELRFKLSMGRLKNFNEVKETKKQIARILTILNEKNNA